MNMYKNFYIVCDYLKMLKKAYENKTNSSFSSLLNKIKKNSFISAHENIVETAIAELVADDLIEVSLEDIESVRAKTPHLVKIKNKFYACNNADINRNISELTIDDIVNIWSCLKISQRENLVLFHYDDIAMFNNRYLKTRADAWDAYNGIFEQCRSVVVNIDDFAIASLPFYKFQNMDETEKFSQARIEKMLSTAKVVEFSDKLDGSMIQMRWYNENILVTSSNSLNPNGCFQLQDAIDYINSNHQYEQLCKDYSDYTIICEWIAENDAHIVHYTESNFGLNLIGIRNVYTGELKSYKEVVEIANKYALNCTTLHSETLHSVLQKIKIYNSAEKEGYVLNIDGFLVKIKCDDFVLIAKTLQEMNSTTNLIKCIVQNTVDDVMAKIPPQHHTVVMAKIQDILNFKNKFNEIVEFYYRMLPFNTDKKTVMIFIDENIPLRLRKFVRNKYLGLDYDILASLKHTTQPKYLSKSEMESWQKFIDNFKV